LEDSPKCNGCSLAGICLPDETCLLHGRGNGGSKSETSEVRQFFPACDEGLPFYVQEQGVIVCKTAKTLVIWKQKEKLATVRVADTSQLVLCGNVSVTPQTIHLLCARWSDSEIVGIARSFEDSMRYDEGEISASSVTRPLEARVVKRFASGFCERICRRKKGNTFCSMLLANLWHRFLRITFFVGQTMSL
jgi:CRISPR associated protein Cas1